MSDKKIKKQFHAAHQHLLSQGLNPRDVAREQRHELMVPKLALVGVFETLENFCKAGKTSVMSTVGPLNTRNLSMFFGALKKSLELGDRLLVEYQNAQNAIKALEIAAELAEQQAEENRDLDALGDGGDDDGEEADDDDDNEEDDDGETEEEGDDSQAEFLKDFDIRKLN